VLELPGGWGGFPPHYLSSSLAPKQLNIWHPPLKNGTGIEKYPFLMFIPPSTFLLIRALIESTRPMLKVPENDINFYKNHQYKNHQHMKSETQEILQWSILIMQQCRMIRSNAA